jgi:hypothetical protein
VSASGSLDHAPAGPQRASPAHQSAHGADGRTRSTDRLKTGAEVSALHSFAVEAAASARASSQALRAVQRGFPGVVTRETKVTRLKIGSDDALLIPAPLHVFFQRADVDERRAPCRYDYPVAAARAADSHRGQLAPRGDRTLDSRRLSDPREVIRGAGDRMRA